MATESGAMTNSDIYNIVMEELGVPMAPEEGKPEEQLEAKAEEDSEAEQPTEDTEQKEEESKEKETEETWFPETIDELAEAMEVDLDALKAIKIKTKVDGIESDVPLGEVIKNYQINKALTERSETLSHEKKDFEKTKAEFQAISQEQVQQWHTWSQILENRLKEQVGAVDWEALRQDDPAEYAARRQEFMERIGELEGMKQAVQQQAVQQQHAQVEWFRNAVQENLKRLPDLIPEYHDAEVMKKDLATVKQYLLGTGFTEDEIGMTYDARQVAIARKAMLYDQMQHNAEPKKNLLKNKPKFIKPNARVNEEEADSKASKDRYKKALKNQKIEDWVQVYMDRL